MQWPLNGIIKWQSGPVISLLRWRLDLTEELPIFKVHLVYNTDSFLSESQVTSSIVKSDVVLDF